MKKWFIYVWMIGAAIGGIFLLCQKQKNNHTTFSNANKKVKKERFESVPQKEDLYYSSDLMENMCQTKNECTQNVYERHLEAGKLMGDSYRNIMEDFVENFSDKENVNEKKEEHGESDICDNKPVSVIKEMDLISKELDDILQ